MHRAAQYLLRSLLTATLTAFVLLCLPFSSIAYAQASSGTHRGGAQPSRSQACGVDQPSRTPAYGVAALPAQSGPSHHRQHHDQAPVEAGDPLTLPRPAADTPGARSPLRTSGSAQHTLRQGRAPPV